MRNIAKCRSCKEVIESIHVHDWVSCKCFAYEVGNQGIFIDGGPDYWRCGGNLHNLIRLDDGGKEFEPHFRITEIE